MKTALIVMALWVASSFTLSSMAFGQQARQKPKELEVLGHYVGDWTSDVTSKPAVWTPAEKRFRTANHAEFVLDGWFLQHIEVNHEIDTPNKVGKSLFVWTFDPRSRKHVKWLFQSSGIIAKWVGTWNPKDKSLTATSQDVPPMTTGKFMEAFPNDSTINGALIFTGNDSKTLFEMVWTRKRQAEVAGQPLRERWAKIGTPIEPIPAEVKKLDVFIGEWDSEFIQRPSVVSPNGNTSKGKMTGEWILDGRFLLGTSEVGNYKSMWVIGYDTNKEAYRYVRMSTGGQIEENLGQWNDRTRSFEWKVVSGQPGITRTSTNRIIGNDAVQAHIIAEDGDGKVHMDLTIRSTRRK